MKISFSGSHRTGKTTLAERIAVDNSMVMGYTNVETTFKTRTIKDFELLEGQFGFYERLLLQENICRHVTGQIKRGDEYSVFDRSAFDVYGYSEFHLSRLLKGFRPRLAEFEAFGKHLEKVAQHFNSVDFTFIIQPGIPFESSAASGSKETQEEINEILLNVAENYLESGKYFIMPREVVDFEERVEVCQKILEEKLIISDRNDIMSF